MLILFTFFWPAIEANQELAQKNSNILAERTNQIEKIDDVYYNVNLICISMNLPCK